MKYGIQKVFPENYRKYSIDSMKHELGQKIVEIVFENEQEILCISPVKYKTLQSPEVGDNSCIRAEIDIDYARQYPVMVTSGFSYEGQPIPPPNELTFRQKLKFLFTGKYPIA